jgi:hypothetical protein
MRRAAETPDERLNDLVVEVTDLTGEDYVTAICRSLEERRDRLVSPAGPGHAGPPARVIRLSLEIPEELLVGAGVPTRDRDA